VRYCPDAYGQAEWPISHCGKYSRHTTAAIKGNVIKQRVPPIIMLYRLDRTGLASADELFPKCVLLRHRRVMFLCNDCVIVTRWQS
jgi:hypothetical protein